MHSNTMDAKPNHRDDWLDFALILLCGFGAMVLIVELMLL